MADEDQRDAREADVAGGDRREAEREEGSDDSRHEQMDSCICSEGIRFLEAARLPRPRLLPRLLQEASALIVIRLLRRIGVKAGEPDFTCLALFAAVSVYAVVDDS